MNEALLSSLTENTPSASLKLSAAWDGLSTESQMEVLYALRERGVLLPDVATKAMASPNAFVRFMAVELAKSGWDLPDALRPAVEAAERDPDPIVQSVFAPTWRVRPEEFWPLPRPSRLASAKRLNFDSFMGIVESAASSGVLESEIEEVAVEHLLAGGTTEYGRNERFWNLVRRLPDGLAGRLAELVPLEDYDREPRLEWLSPRALEVLLPRGDAPLKKIRKQVFLDVALLESNWLRSAAASRFLQLTDEEFHTIRGRRECLAALGDAGSASLSLAQWEFLTSPGQDGWSSEPRKEGEHLVEATAIGMVEERAKLLDGLRRRIEVVELRILLLARALSIAAANERRDPWIDETVTLMSDALLLFNLSQSTVVPGDTWATYLNLKRDLLKGRSGAGYPHRFLPVHACMTESDLDPEMNVERRLAIEVAKARSEVLKERQHEKESKERPKPSPMKRVAYSSLFSSFALFVIVQILKELRWDLFSFEFWGGALTLWFFVAGLGLGLATFAEAIREGK